MVEAESPPAQRKRPWVLSFFCILAIGGLVAMPLLAGKPGAQEMPDMVRFLGHFHPFLLHLPIGVFALILFQEIGAIFCRRNQGSGAGSLFPMFFGAASAILAVIAGFLLYHGHAEDYNENPLAERHLWGGLAFAVAAVFTFMLKAWSVSSAAKAVWYRMLLFASVGVMAYASHDGASITHGSDYLARYAPASIRGFLGGSNGEKPEVVGAVVKPVAEQVVYVDIVQPIIERRCVSCHKESKSKGKLRMDTYELLLKGGKSGPAIEPGKADESEAIVRIDLPEDDEEHMPPEGKPDIEDHEVLVLKWWINSGAEPNKKLADVEVPADVKEAIAKLTRDAPAAGAPAAGHPTPAAAAGPDEALKTAVAGLSQQFPGSLTFESQDSKWVTFTAVSLRSKLDDETFAKFGPILPSLVTLDLSSTKITDKTVAALPVAKHLRMVRLSETGITDASIDTLLKLPTLESINLYGTKITDAGILKLSGMPNLKRLYLWQTPVTPETIKTLKEKLPKCEIVTGS
jgi:uncharacterized membrane protein